MKTFKKFLDERCWTGHKPVPGKKPYSPGSCKKEDVEIDESSYSAKPVDRSPTKRELERKVKAPKGEYERKVEKYLKKKYNKEEVEIDEAAKWRSTSVAKKVTDPDDESSRSYDYHHENPRSTGMKQATSDKPYSSGSLMTRPKAQVASQGARKGMVTKQHAASLKDRIKSAMRKEEYEPDDGPLTEDQLDEVAAWQRKEGKSESGGLNRKGIASYRRENPGSKLSMAVTTKPSKLKAGSKAANRRKSFCARMSGMKRRLTSAKTARDPNSRINKSLRKWNC